MLIPAEPFTLVHRSTMTHPSYSRVFCNCPLDGVVGLSHGVASNVPTQKSKVWTARQGCRASSAVLCAGWLGDDGFCVSLLATGAPARASVEAKIKCFN